MPSWVPPWVPKWTRRRWTWGVIAALVLVIVILQVTGDDAGQVAEPSEGPPTPQQDELPHEQPAPDTLPFAEDAVLLRRLLVAAESDGGVDYDRDAYQPGGWGDADGDGCNTREEVLIAEARSITQIDQGCRPIDGTWWSWYDEVELDDPGRIQIDHMVPLLEAHQSGASEWASPRRVDFANDLGSPASLAAVSASSNQDKRAQDPAEWKPPSRAAWCQYARDWTTVKLRWGLTADPSEIVALREMLATCIAPPSSRPAEFPNRDVERKTSGGAGTGRTGFGADSTARDDDSGGVVCETWTAGLSYGQQATRKDEIMTDIYYSCDSHVVEGPEVFDGLVDRFGDRAPRVVNKWKDRDAVFVAWPSIDFAMSVGRLGIAGANLNLPETKEKIARGWDLINPGVKDPVARLKEQDQDGIVGEVMYPSINMLTFMVDDVEVVDAVFQRHNNWIRDYCSHAPERLIGVGCITLRDIDMAIAELKRCAQMGIKGVAIPCTAPVDKPYSDPYYEPFWEAAEDIGLPLTMHIFCGSEPGMSLPKDWDQVVSYTLAHAAAWNTVSNLVTSGVCERHPKLRFVMAEWETGWIGHVLQRWDHAYYRARAVDQTPELPMLPTEYFHRQFTVTFEDDDIGVRTRNEIGIENLVWGNDYPHHDAIWPNSRRILSEIMEGVSEADQEAMVWGNVQKLYNIDRSALPV